MLRTRPVGQKSISSAFHIKLMVNSNSYTSNDSSHENSLNNNQLNEEC